MAYDLGVDLGTTYTCAGRTRDGRTELVQLGHTSPLVPSVVSIREDGEFVVGETAERRAVTDPSRTVREFKRRLGDEAPYVIGGKAFGPEALAGELLRSVITSVQDAEGEPARRIALTHPANYGPFKLGKLREAAALAGLDDPLLVPEPVAAALWYAQRERIPEGGYVLVYDLGGGTFDVAVVQLAAAGPQVIGTPDGLERLGGIDFDAAVLNHVDRALGGRIHAADGDDGDTRAALARLRDECRAAKEALSADTETQIPVLLPDLHETVRLTRGELEQMLRPRLEDTFPVVDRVVASASLAMADISAILTVGGSSRIPLVAELLRERTGRPVAVDPYPKASVALGAAAVAVGTELSATEPVPAVTGASVASAADDTVATPAVVRAGAAEDADTTVVGVAAVAAEAPRSKRNRKILVAAIVAVVLIGGGAAAALAGGSGSSGGKAAAHGTTTTDKHKTTTTRRASTAKKPGKGAKPGKKASQPRTTATVTTPGGRVVYVYPGSGQPVTNPGGGYTQPTSSGQTQGHPTQTTPHTTPHVTPTTHAPTPTTKPAPPRPTIAAHASTGNVICFPGDNSEVIDISWTSTNATEVQFADYPPPLQQYGTQTPNDSLGMEVFCDGRGPTYATLTARGAGGTATKTITWQITHAQT